MPSPIDRSRAALPANIRKTLEESNLPVEVATAIADLCEGLLPPEAAPTKDDLRECLAFWQHYSSVNEGAQDDMAEERNVMLDRMGRWLDASEPQQEPAHTDHPLRHFDRTCPACNAASQAFPDKEKS